MDLLDKAKNYVAEKVGHMERPEATITDVDLKKIGLGGLSFHAKVAVKNPYSVPIPIMEIDYCLKSASREIAKGRIPDPGNIKGNDTTMLDVPVQVPHSVLVTLVRDIGADWDIDYTLVLGLIIDLPVIGSFTIPLSYSGDYKLPTLSDLWKGSGKEEEEEETAKVTEI